MRRRQGLTIYAPLSQASSYLLSPANGERTQLLAPPPRATPGAGAGRLAESFLHLTLTSHCSVKARKGRQGSLSAQREPVGYLSLGLKASALLHPPRLEGMCLFKSYLVRGGRACVCPHAYTHVVVKAARIKVFLHL